MDAVAAGGAVRGLHNPWSNPLQRKKGWLPGGAFLFCAVQNTIVRPERCACSGGVGEVSRSPSRRGGAARSGAGPALPRPLL